MRRLNAKTLLVATRTLCLGLCQLVNFASLLFADDWPQAQGPFRNNKSAETGLLEDWPEDGPELLWTFKNAGTGYSGPAITGDRIYLMGGRGGSAYGSLNRSSGQRYDSRFVIYYLLTVFKLSR